MKKILLLILLTSSGVYAQTAYHAVLFDGSAATPWVRLMAMTLAGIVNRDSARLYLQNVYEPWSDNQTDERWATIYRTRGNVTFDVVTSDTVLVNRFRSFIRGGIRYDYSRYFGNFPGQTFMWQGEYAALIGGLTDRLPLTMNQWVRYRLPIDDSVLVTDAFDGDSAAWVPGKLDTASLAWNNPSLLTEESRYLTLLDWGIRTLLPRCNPREGYIREITDFTVQRRMFQLNLAGTSDLKIDSIPAARFDLIERMVTFLHAQNPSSIVHLYGWVQPEALVQWLAYFGASFHETLLANLSWHDTFPAAVRSFAPPSQVCPDTVQVRDKYYLLFLSSEGDASNWVFSLQSGAWLSPKRGTVPMGWGWNLHLLSLCPFVAGYYYDTATPNDGFVSVLTPLGYSYPDYWQDDVFQSAVDSSRDLMQRFGVSVIYGYKHYEGSGAKTYRGKLITDDFQIDRYALFQNAIGASATLFFNSSPASHVPTVYQQALLFNHKTDGTFYADVHDLSATATRLVQLIQTLPRPGFLLAGYQRFRSDNIAPGSMGTEDLTVSRLDSLVRLIKSDPTVGADVEVVTSEYFAALMRTSLGMTPVHPDAVPPSRFVLRPNYPNPFNPSTLISVEVPVGGLVSVTIHDLLGRTVAVLQNGPLQPGVHRFRWDASGASSGVYFCRATAGGTTTTRRMMLIR